MAAVQLEFISWGWIFREQVTDSGIDAYVEEVNDQYQTGRLIALVVKAGVSHFSEAVPDGWVYRGHSADLLYWVRQVLPVVLLVHDTRTSVTYWAHITLDAVQYDDRGWRILLPATQIFGPASRRAFESVVDSGSNTSQGDQEITHWFEADQAVAHAEAAAAEPVRQPSAEEFYDWLGTLIDRFQHAVEQSDLWRALWDDKLTRPRGEKIIQAIAGTMWTILCEAADVDITREANVGRGPVDFKFSAGWRRRALIEVKLLASSKLRQGAEAQLPQYMASERLSCAYYVCVGFTDDDFRPERLQLVRDTCAEYQAKSKKTVRARFIDARPKKSASKLERRLQN